MLSFGFLLVCRQPFGVDGDLRKVPEAWSEARWKDARALVNIESSFYKLVGGRKLGVLDPAFLRLIAHIVVGDSHQQLLFLPTSQVSICFRVC